jgi:hypothetical protein
MQFEQITEGIYQHRLALESAKGEVETVAAAYRELVNLKAKEDRLHEIHKYEREFSMWASSPDRAILTNFPLPIAEVLESFHGRTIAAIREIVATNPEPAFESDAVARRMYLGDKALQMAGLIRIEFDTENLQQELDNYVDSVTADPESAPERPID